MKPRPFGKTGLTVSPLTFGAWSIGGPARLGDLPIGWTGVSEAGSIRALQTALDAGITVFDTADMYAEGRSERLIGQALAARREAFVLVTKTGIVGIDEGGIVLDFSPDRITAACEASLKRLSTDHIDVYLMHLVNDRTFPGEATKDALEGLKARGLIRHYGISVQFPHQGIRQIEEGFGDALMLEYNPFKAGEERDVLDLAHDHGFGVITRGALEKGLLTGKYAPGHTFSPDDVRSRIPEASRDRILNRVQRLKEDYQLTSTDLLQMALNFPLQHPGCSTIAVGMKTADQVRQLIEGLTAEPVDIDFIELLQDSRPDL
jgi:aryl-alcohol dehydrogenase-like predicted oxidoreductase